jgi:hypothetical protein
MSDEKVDRLFAKIVRVMRIVAGEVKDDRSPSTPQEIRIRRLAEHLVAKDGPLPPHNPELRIV